MTEVLFPRHYKKLPAGYKIIWLDSIEKYMWIQGDLEGSISWDRFWCRRCAFAHEAAK